MLDQTTLSELKTKMPRGYLKLVASKYEAVNGSPVSRKTVDRFFRGETSNPAIHQAVLGVIDDQASLMEQTMEVIKTTEA
ncbi:hypothetical protein ACRQ5D_10665 [Mucilaginibacter sp. P25]|uniref:hypothetical protein n=1 Tax=Mucilaginibacter sp. P25 TaxID=3423945 RepID=UPI003D79B43F